ncbi:hypothetical protein PVAP13_3NG049700 [Panicum virgatum]|uniref:Uncharacterized protein n=1 Tax=Panicum virgatum TaxID=38727 RepID=A0A8T0U469_PANVG|nr:hypothetical protein PVAP13_3NG049700 [Panicum virgatum]
MLPKMIRTTSKCARQRKVLKFMLGMRCIWN